MKQKKGSASTEPQERRRSVKMKGYGIRETNGVKNCKIQYYPDGVSLNAPAMGRTNKTSCIIRSEISHWSTASRRRMREYMLTHKLPENMIGFDCTYTIPGPYLPEAKMNQLKNTWQIYLRRVGGCCIWRAEVQERGMLHYHLIAGLPVKEYPGLPPEFLRQYNGLKGREILKDVWLRSLSSLGEMKWWVVGQYHHFETLPSVPEGCCRLELEDEFKKPFFMDLTTEEPASMWGVTRFNGPDCPTDLSKWWGAEKYSTKIGVLDDVYGAWKRYLNDHTSKAKQEQIGANIGRHWGVIGRNQFQDVSPDFEIELSWQQYAAFLRCWHRLCTPYNKCDGALFGKRRGYKPTRGRSGRTVSFSNPATLRRLADWAVSE